MTPFLGNNEITDDKVTCQDRDGERSLDLCYYFRVYAANENRRACNGRLVP